MTEISEIQKRVDETTTRLQAKGLLRVRVQLFIRANEEPQFYATWEDKRKNNDYDYIFLTAASADLTMDKADEWVAGLPSAEENRRNQFLSAVGGVIELGRNLDMDVDFLNPLSDMMKRLSENAITHQREVA